MSDDAPRTPCTPVEVVAARLEAILAHYGPDILSRRGVPEVVTVAEEPQFPELPPEPEKDEADRVTIRVSVACAYPGCAKEAYTRVRGYCAGHGYRAKRGLPMDPPFTPHNRKTDADPCRRCGTLSWRRTGKSRSCAKCNRDRVTASRAALRQAEAC